MLEPGGSPFRSVRYADRSRLRTAPRVALVATLVVLLSLSGGFLVLWVQANRAIGATVVDGLARADEQVTNVVVVSAAAPGEPVDGVGVLQLTPARDQPVVLVLPAALEVDVPDVGTVTLGETPGVGGMALLVEEVGRYTGLDVHHYVRVDREPLAALVDVSGGLDDCPTPDADPCPRLIGDDVLERLAPPTGAVTGRDRVVAHLDVARVVAAEVGRARTVLDPRRALRWAGGWDDVLTTDVDPGVRGARDLADVLAGVDPEALDVRVLPGLVDDGRITVSPETSAVLLDAFVQLTELPADIGLEAPRELTAADVTVQVLNGVGRAGVAGDMADFLTERGFVVADVDNALRFDPRAPTTIGYAGGDLPLAELVASFLPDAELEEVAETPPGVRVVVTVGTGGAP